MTATEVGRKVVANCYFHAGMPALVRRFRDQYRVAISSGGRWPRFSIEKRNEPSARILYYHRVNDDNDPFFPSISTALFEQEMRFVKGHYTVVSLTEMLERLAGGATEPVMAITFDDGYQDNYHNAFPVLQRLGLPATIFLTTGSMDSREPLWFEQLALAVKKTGRECLDAELGATERLWMRTPVERLAANGKLFGFLRSLPDTERQSMLASILRQLFAAGAGERRDQMLTWEQARLMSGRGITFGGHTVSHPFLSRLTAEGLKWEVAECKRRIEDELQLAAEYFAYPNGREEDFSQPSKQAICAAGYRAAVTTIWGTNYRSTDPLELRRGQPWEEHLALFAYKLDWYQLVNE
jgi:peptidoglycan/xylan/chitin deacetylase (PgdA/CDA1 family)